MTETFVDGLQLVVATKGRERQYWVAVTTRKKAATVVQKLLEVGWKASLTCCVVLDISNGGARLSFTARLAVFPRTFTLVLFKDSVQRDCELVGSGRGLVGVKFISQWFGTKSSECGLTSKTHT
jgi:hypothetical protein